ncbi:MAG TPA: YjgN family protein [Herbaspirillum sp.]|uniref:YjgN family protein n=1 Tax=Herbaspirillum sp. TaxID=1890675 RepID=UPI002D702BDC|nr:YjgN family protein [Herbaspirillum sp.]HZG20348.1 YjgN family protein [Herbaspirillum sp.]
MNDTIDLPFPSEPSPEPVPAGIIAPPPSPQPFVFSGRGSEYFRIWIVNLLLSILTLGIYSAWAKVRRLRYFYDNTSVAEGSFDYHGNPLSILKGRIIAVVLLALYHFAGATNPLLGLAAALVMVLAGPWLIWRSLQFKLYNTSYRGIRFGFRGSLGGAVRNFLMWPTLAGISLGLLAPLAYQRFKRYQHSEARFGATHFSFHGSVGAFYKTFLIGLGLWLGGLVAIFVAFGGVMLIHLFPLGGMIAFKLVLMSLSLYAWSFLAIPLWMILLQNLVWNNTRLGEHRFQSRMRWGRTAFIVFTNILGIAFTLGLFTPFAQIRLLRYRIESLTLLPASGLDDFIASSEAHGSATGEGLGDLLDFDLSM